MTTTDTFETYTTKLTQKLINKLTLPTARLEHITSILDSLAKHFTNKPGTINRIATCEIPEPNNLILALIHLATTYSPETRPLEIKKWLTVNIPWLDTNTQHHVIRVCLVVLNYLEEWLEYSQGHKVLSKEHVSMRIYRLLNCLIAGLGTTALFYGMIPQATNQTDIIAYLFVVAGCYTLLDHLVDNVGSSQSNTTKQAISIFDWYITQLETGSHTQPFPQYPSDQLTPIMQEYNLAIYWLIGLLVRSVHIPEVVGIIRLCLNVEIRCFREQTRSSQSPNSIIQLGVLKGLSTGYLISQGALTTLYSEYSVLVQLLDDLSDYIEDSHAGISGFPMCASGLDEYAILVGEFLAEFINKYTAYLVRDPDLMLGGPDAAEYVIPALIMYWIYCMCKTPQLADLTRDCISRFGLDEIMDPYRILESRREKHASLQNLWKIVKQFRA